MPTPRTYKYRYCTYCGESFPQPKSNHVCSACANKVRSVRNRLILDGFLAAGCVDCGEKDPIVLEVHHRTARNGREASATTNGRTPAQLRRHLEDCEVLCANCHKRRHYSGSVLDKYGHMVGPRAPRKKGFDAPTTKVTPAMYRQIVTDFHDHGLSMKQIARKHGIGATTVSRWLWKYEKEQTTP
jgi:5-methylcytosine-specific restriction endonuclease McrA